MLLFSSECINNVLITFIILQAISYVIQVETAFSAAKALKRTRPETRFASQPPPPPPPPPPKTSISSAASHSRSVGLETHPLIDPMAGTHIEHLDPTRDGAIARMKMRNRILSYGATAVVGSAIGAAGLAAKELLFKNESIITQPTNVARNISNQTKNLNDIENSF